MKLHYLCLAALVLPLSGCFMAQKSALVQSKQFYDSSSQARIRLYGNYGDTVIKHYMDRTCNEWRATSATRLHHRFNNGTPRRIKNISAGIPMTEQSVRTMNDKGIMTRGSFKEYVVDANKPLVLDASISVNLDNFSHSCRIAMSFIPQVGKDYEANYVERNGRCTIEVDELQPISEKQQVALTKDVTQLQSCSLPGDSTK